MARVTFVKKAQASKNARVCRTCNQPIEVGMAYKWFATRIGRSSIRKNYHSGCNIPRSAFTTSDKLADLYDAQDSIDKAYGKEDIAAALEDAADVADDVASRYEESADNIVEGFGHETMQSEEIREKAEAATAWGDVLRDAQSEIESLDESDLDESDLEAQVENEMESEDEDDDVAVRERIVEDMLAEVARDKANDASSELEL